MKNREFSFHSPHKITDKGECPAVNLECPYANREAPMPIGRMSTEIGSETMSLRAAPKRKPPLAG